MKQNTIAIIYDFDGTLTPKTMQEYTLLPKLGVKSKSFWDEISQEVSKTGAETMMVYMRQLLDHAKNKNIKISKDEFLKMGRDIKYYSGVEKWFTNINSYIRKISKNDVNIKHYIISAGHAEILEGISIKKYIKKIFASEYYYRRKVAVFPKIVVTDTTKTQFIFRINKGKEKLSQSINEHMPETDRPIPFDNIIALEVAYPSLSQLNVNALVAIPTLPFCARTLATPVDPMESVKSPVNELYAALVTLA